MERIQENRVEYGMAIDERINNLLIEVLWNKRFVTVTLEENK
jgi:hypothetical protein